MNPKEEESSGIFSIYFPMGLMGQTWFISCLFFMKLRPQKWQVPVLLVTAPAPGPELWLSRALSGRSSSLCWVGGSALPGTGAAGWGSLNMYDLLVTLLELFTLRSTEMPLLYRNQFQFGLYFLRTSIRMNGLVIRENILQIQRNFGFRLLLWLSKCTRMCIRICWHGQILTPLRGHPAACYVHWNTSIKLQSLSRFSFSRMLTLSEIRSHKFFQEIYKFSNYM